jgi:hypothetical protein
MHQLQRPTGTSTSEITSQLLSILSQDDDVQEIVSEKVTTKKGKKAKSKTSAKSHVAANPQTSNRLIKDICRWSVVLVGSSCPAYLGLAMLGIVTEPCSTDPLCPARPLRSGEAGFDEIITDHGVFRAHPAVGHIPSSHHIHLIIQSCHNLVSPFCEVLPLKAASRAPCNCPNSPSAWMRAS